MLRSLDAELQRIQQLEADAAPATAPGVPTATPVDVDEEIGPGKESPKTPNRRSSNSAWEEDTTAPVVVRRSEQGPDEESVAFASLPTVAEKRRKHMSWIHKKVDQKFPGGRESVRGDGKLQPVFSRLHAQYATDTVRMAAINEFDQVAFEEAEQESCWVRLARNPFFERISLTMIYFNAVWLAVDIEFNDSDLVMFSSPVFIVAEVVFSVYFTAEVIVRYMLYTSTMKAFKDLWFLFDFFLVIMMVSETWIVPVFVLIMDSNSEGSNLSRTVSVLRVARALRVLRTARIVRVARYMPEPMILLKGIMVAARSVFFTLVLLLLITYVFSIALSKMSEGTALEDSLFRSLPSSLLTLIVKCVIPDREIFFREVARESWLMGALVLFFVLVGSLIVLNMLVGILVEAVQTVATMEHEQIRVDLAKTVLWDLVTKGTKNHDRELNQITEEELAELLEWPEATSALTQLGVDIFAVKEYSKLLFEDGEPLTFGEFMDAMLTLRGSNSTTVKDIVNLRKFTADEFSQLHTVLLDMIRFLAGQGMSQRLVSDLNDQKKTSAMNHQRSS